MAPKPSNPQNQTQQLNKPRFTADNRAPQMSQDRRDGTGTTFGGRGQKMDVDEARKKGLCFNCGEQGHIKRFCPKNAQAQVRAAVVNMDQLDEHAEETRSILRRMTKEARRGLLEELKLVDQKEDFAEPQQ